MFPFQVQSKAIWHGGSLQNHERTAIYCLLPLTRMTDFDDERGPLPKICDLKYSEKLWVIGMDSAYNLLASS